MTFTAPFAASPPRLERRLAALVAASVVQVALMLAVGAWHLERARQTSGETFMDLLPVVPAAPRKPSVPTPVLRLRPAPRRMPLARPSLIRPPAPVDAPSADAAAPSADAAVPESPPTPPQAPLDLGAATLRRAIEEAARASGSVAAQAGRTTRPTLAQRHAQAIEQAKIDDCLTPEGQGKPSKSQVQLDGLLRLPGLLVDAATGKCSLK